MAIRILYLLLIVFSSLSYSKDIIKLNLCDEINKRIPSDFNVVDVLEGEGTYYIWAHMEFNPDGRLEPETYYLQWTYDNGTKEVVLDNYNTNDYLKFDRGTTKIREYWWVVKTIYDDKPGTYTFTIRVKEEGVFIKVAEKELKVGV